MELQLGAEEGLFKDSHLHIAIMVVSRLIVVGVSLFSRALTRGYIESRKRSRISEIVGPVMW